MSNRAELPPKQAAILDFIRQFMDAHAYPPSVREIRNGCGISSTSVVDYQLKALDRDGWIERDGRINRSIRLLDGHGATAVREIAVPLCGTLRADRLPPKREPMALPDWVACPEPLLRDAREPYALVIHGTHFEERALLADGDRVVLTESFDRQGGFVGVVRIFSGFETAIARIERDPPFVVLRDLVGLQAGRYVEAADCAIIARVVTALRYYL